MYTNSNIGHSKKHSYKVNGRFPQINILNSSIISL